MIWNLKEDHKPNRSTTSLKMQEDSYPHEFFVSVLTDLNVNNPLCLIYQGFVDVGKISFVNCGCLPKERAQLDLPSFGLINPPYSIPTTINDFMIASLNA